MQGIPGLGDGPTGVEMDTPAKAPQPMRPSKPQSGPSTFTILKTETCQWCQVTLQFLEALQQQRDDVEIKVLDANAEPAAFRKLASVTRRTTVPQIFLDGGFVGGWNDLVQAAKSGKLDAYLDGREWAKA